jgi:UDP-N-acetyl-D-mannosaminuronic acid dehydrogenase
VNEPGLAALLEKVVRNKTLTVSAETPESCDVFIVAVQTPLATERSADLSPLERACSDIGKRLSPGKLVVIECTVAPGTTATKIASLLESISGLRCGQEFWLAHCPERISPGNALQEFSANPRAIGGYDATSCTVALELYKTVIKSGLKTCDCTTAETVKCAENAFRDVNIAFANELAMVCEKLGIDAAEVIGLANDHPRVKVHQPGCGVGGHCLTKDSLLLLEPAEKQGFRSRVIRNSRELNQHMPRHTVELAVSGMRQLSKDIRGAKIAVLGVTYKKDVNDVRNAPSEEIIRILGSLGAHVVVFDPFSKEGFGAEVARTLNDALENADCLILATDHSVFDKLDLRVVRSKMRDHPLIVDGRLFFNPDRVTSLGFSYAGIGRRAILRTLPPGLNEESRVDAPPRPGSAG